MSLIFQTAGILANQCVQERLTCSVGVSPTGVEVRSPLAWVVSVEETKRMKPTDKAIFGMVSESPGRNASEPTGGLETEKLRRPSPLGWGEGSRAWRGLTDAACHSGGVVGTARWQGHVEQLEKPSSPHRAIGGAG